jgi:putative membrane protein
VSQGFRRRPFRRNLHQHERDWFRVLFCLQGSVIPAVLPRVLICCGFAMIIAVLHSYGWQVSLPMLGSLVPSIVLGLLLVFRTNTAYERYWEGRILWGSIVNTVRNLARQIWVAIAEIGPEDKAAKIHTVRLLAAFAVAIKLHLRAEPPDDELLSLVTPEQFAKLQQMNNPPLEVAFWIADYLQAQKEQGNLNAYQLTACLSALDDLVNALGGCERVLKTPIPLAYSIHLKQLLLLYCLALPFQMVGALGWWTPLIVGLISFAVFGIEEIGIEIENPFGDDPNDLPLDEICLTMQENLEDLISLCPSAQSWRRESLGSSMRS